MEWLHDTRHASLLAELAGFAHPGFRDWLNGTCQQAGFSPRVLQEAELEPALMTFVAEGLGVSLAREHIKKLTHPGVTLRPLAPPVLTDYCIAWNRDNDSRALQQYIEIVKRLAAHAPRAPISAATSTRSPTSRPSRGRATTTTWA